LNVLVMGWFMLVMGWMQRGVGANVPAASLNLPSSLSTGGIEQPERMPC
jgi:hypothetical protein